MKAFRRLDQDGSGQLTVDDLIGTFNAARHPQVLSGELTERQALEVSNYYLKCSFLL